MQWPEDSLDDFEKRSVELIGETRTVYVGGSGPAVIVMAEMPGIGPLVARFARWVRDAGMTVYMPSLFGRDGAVPDAEEAATIFRQACISIEFRALGGNASSPIAAWLRALARVAFDECGGPGVGAIGMCFTGNFALTMLLEPAVIAAVLAQPALPLDCPAALEISPDELSTVKERLDREGISVPAYRFAGDHFCRAERFSAYRAALGDRFEPHVIPDIGANPVVPPFTAAYVKTPHSVLTAHLIDEEGQPTRAARDEIIAYFRQRLKV